MMDPKYLQWDEIQINDIITPQIRWNEKPAKKKEAGEDQPYRDSYEMLELEWKERPSIHFNQMAFEPHGVPFFVVTKSFPFLLCRPLADPNDLIPVDFTRFGLVKLDGDYANIYRLNHFNHWDRYENRLKIMKLYSEGKKVRAMSPIKPTVLHEACSTCGYTLTIGVVSDEGRLTVRCDSCDSIHGYLDFVKLSQPIRS